MEPGSSEWYYFSFSGLSLCFAGDDIAVLQGSNFEIGSSRAKLLFAVGYKKRSVPIEVGVGFW